jgi:hypothetical protein
MSRSVDFRARIAHDFSLLGDLGLDERGELLGRARLQIDALRDEALLHIALRDAPGRLSTTNACPRRCDSFSAIARDIRSVGPEGAKRTIQRTGLLG